MAERRRIPVLRVEQGRPATGLERQLGPGVITPKALDSLTTKLQQFGAKALAPAQEEALKKVQAEAALDQEEAGTQALQRREAGGPLGVFDAPYVEAYNQQARKIAGAKLREQFLRDLEQARVTFKSTGLQEYQKFVDELYSQYANKMMELDPTGALLAEENDFFWTTARGMIVKRAKEEVDFQLSQLHAQAREAIHRQVAGMSDYATSLAALTRSGFVQLDDAEAALSEAVRRLRDELNARFLNRDITEEEYLKLWTDAHDYAFSKFVSPLLQHYRDTGQWDKYAALADKINRGFFFEDDRVVAGIPKRARQGADKLVTDIIERTNRQAAVNPLQLLTGAIPGTASVRPDNIPTVLGMRRQNKLLREATESVLSARTASGNIIASDPAIRDKYAATIVTGLGLEYIFSSDDPTKLPDTLTMQQRLEEINQGRVTFGELMDVLRKRDPKYAKRVERAAAELGLRSDTQISGANIRYLGGVFTDDLPQFFKQINDKAINDPSGAAVQAVRPTKTDLRADIDSVLQQDPRTWGSGLRERFEFSRRAQAAIPDLANRPWRVPQEYTDRIIEQSEELIRQGRPQHAALLVFSGVNAAASVTPDPQASQELLDAAVVRLRELGKDSQQPPEVRTRANHLAASLAAYRYLQPVEGGLGDPITLRVGDEDREVTEILIEAMDRPPDPAERVRVDDLLRRGVPPQLAESLVLVWPKLTDDERDAFVEFGKEHTVVDEDTGRTVALLPTRLPHARDLEEAGLEPKRFYRRVLERGSKMVRTLGLNMSDGRVTETVRQAILESAGLDNTWTIDFSPANLANLDRLRYDPVYEDGKLIWVVRNTVRDTTPIPAAVPGEVRDNADFVRPEHLQNFQGRLTIPVIARDPTGGIRRTIYVRIEIDSERAYDAVVTRQPVVHTIVGEPTAIARERDVDEWVKRGLIRFRVVSAQ